VPLPEPWSFFAEPNLVYVNDGSGRFSSVNKPFAAFCDPIETSHGLAIGDIDRDGDVDFVVSNVNGPAHIYRNDAPRAGRWLSVRALDPRYHRDAIGARVTVICGAKRFVRSVVAGFSYLSSSEPVAHFGLGPIERVDAIEVRWPDGRVERFPGGEPDRAVTLVRGEGKAGS